MGHGDGEVVSAIFGGRDSGEVEVLRFYEALSKAVER